VHGDVFRARHPTDRLALPAEMRRYALEGSSDAKEVNDLPPSRARTSKANSQSFYMAGTSSRGRTLCSISCSEASMSRRALLGSLGRAFSFGEDHGNLLYPAVEHNKKRKVKILPPLGPSLVASSVLLALCCIGPSEKAQRPVEVLELLPGPSWPLAQDASPWALPLPGHVAVFALPGLKGSDVIRVSRDPRMAQWVPEIAVSDDGRFLLAGLESRSLWDLRRGRFLGVLRVDGAYAWLPLGPDAERVAILRGSRGTGYGFLVWDRQRREVVVEQFFAQSRPYFLTVSRNRRWAAFSVEGKRLYFWNDADRVLRPLALALEPRHAVTGVLFSDDERRLAVGVGTAVDLYDTTSLRRTLRLVPRGAASRRGGLSPLRFMNADRELLATEAEWERLRFSLASGEMLELVRDWSLPPANRLLRGSRSGRGRRRPVQSVAWGASLDGRVLVTIPQGYATLVVHELEGTRYAPRWLCERDCLEDRPTIRDLRVSPDGRWAYLQTTKRGSAREQFELWDLEKGEWRELRLKAGPAAPPASPSAGGCARAPEACLQNGASALARGSAAEARAWLSAACESGLSEGCQQLFEAGEALALGEDERRLALERGCLAGGKALCAELVRTLAPDTLSATVARLCALSPADCYSGASR
jgi:hypothetical protein